MANDSSLTPLPIGERLRHLEILKYGCNLNDNHRSPPNGREDGVDKSPRTLSSDPTLTAFAQLAVLRMNCKHAFISLIDASEQHCVAEATPSISSFDASVHDLNHQLLFGVTTIKRGYSLSDVSLSIFMEDDKHCTDSEISYADSSRHVVADLQADERLTGVPFVREHANFKFFAEVPLRNPRGLVVGTVCVVGEEVRRDPGNISVRALQDVARMTMDHYELVRLKEVNTRAQRLMQGMEHFNSGRASISQWVMDNPDQILSDDVENHQVQHRDRPNSPFSPSPPSSAAPSSPSSSSSSRQQSPPSNPSSTDDSKPVEEGQSQPAEMPGGVGNEAAEEKSDPSSQQAQESSTPKTETPSGHGHSMPSSHPATNQSASSASYADARSSKVSSRDMSGAIKAVFARASNVIRESMNLEATCFLEAGPDGRLPRQPPKRSERKSGQDAASDPSSSSTSDTEGGGPRQSSATKQKGSAPSDERPNFCRRIAFSTLQKSTLALSSLKKDSLTLPESSLRRLAARYPRGHIFHFDAFGALSSEDERASLQERVPLRRKLADKISFHFSGARSLIFLPLYDNETQHLYAGFVGWTSDPFRVLLDGEFVYVSGFANSVMCEVMRLEALVLDRAKSEFMSSMSHELRSPLHGILAATQLIEDTDLSIGQRELAVMVDSCGRTLLDIVNNLLDHAKINNILNRNNKRLTLSDRPKHAALASHTEQLEVNPDSSEQIDLAALVEETVTAVAVGHSVKEQRMKQVAHKPPSSGPSKSGPASSDEEPKPKERADLLHRLPPSVIIDVEYRDDWLFDTDPGAWRRIVVNLIGNALKYTEHGYVHIELRSLKSRQGKKQESQDQVVLKIADSGRGISDSYLRHRLYTPFAQEDILSVGVGLGLSIVNRIVSALKGEIKIESTVSVGTHITVTLPLVVKPQRTTSSRMADDEEFKSARELSRQGVAACFVGFDLPLPENDSDSKQKLHVTTIHKMKQSLTNLLRDWFALAITDDQGKASLIMVEQVHATDLFKEDPGNIIFKKNYVVVTVFDNADMERTAWTGRYYGIAAPIGPRKLARMLHLALKHADDPSRRAEYIQQGSREQWSSSGQPRVDSELKEAASGETQRNDSESTRTLSSSAGQADTDQSRSQKCKLLLVDDNNINLRILENLVRKLKLPYVRAMDGRVALDSYIESHEQGDPISIVLMDISMPIMDGLTSTRHIRAYEKEVGLTKPAKIIALTGLGREESQSEARKSGMDMYFCKPVKLAMLKDLLTQEDS